MNPTRTDRKRRKPLLAAEQLETRQMLTGGVGSTFAIIPATITKAGGQATVTFQLNPNYFTSPGNKPFLLGIDVAAGNNSTANPSVVSVTSPTGKSLPVAHTPFDPAVKRSGAASLNKMSSAVLVTVPSLPAKTATSFTYKIQVAGMGQSSGAILVGFYLPGDSSGLGSVNQTSLNGIKYALGTNGSDTTGKYSFDADTNRDGQINAKDLSLAAKNLGVGTTVSPVISANTAPAALIDPKARITNQNHVAITGVATPNAAITYAEMGEVPVKTTADKLGNYAVVLPLLTGINAYQVTTADAFGQTISGAINSITYKPSLMAAISSAAVPNATMTTPKVG